MGALTAAFLHGCGNKCKENIEGIAKPTGNDNCAGWIDYSNSLNGFREECAEEEEFTGAESTANSEKASTCCTKVKAVGDQAEKDALAEWSKYRQDGGDNDPELKCEKYSVHFDSILSSSSYKSCTQTTAKDEAVAGMKTELCAIEPEPTNCPRFTE